jgi:hypothetical protein
MLLELAFSIDAMLCEKALEEILDSNRQLCFIATCFCCNINNIK